MYRGKSPDHREKAGYQSSHSFSRTFRACMGMSPNEYREQKK
ncbi:MAG: AraC family transcriptional regulator [Lachnospiraceae bacterium]